MRLEHATQVYAHRRALLTDALDARGLPWLVGPDGLNVRIPLAGAAQAAVAEEPAVHGRAARPGSPFTMTRRAAVRATTTTLVPEYAEAFAARLCTTL